MTTKDDGDAQASDASDTDDTSDDTDDPGDSSDTSATSDTTDDTDDPGDSSDDTSDSTDADDTSDTSDTTDSTDADDTDDTSDTTDSTDADDTDDTSDTTDSTDADDTDDTSDTTDSTDADDTDDASDSTDADDTDDTSDTTDSTDADDTDDTSDTTDSTDADDTDDTSDTTDSTDADDTDDTSDTTDSTDADDTDDASDTSDTDDADDTTATDDADLPSDSGDEPATEASEPETHDEPAGATGAGDADTSADAEPQPEDSAAPTEDAATSPTPEELADEIVRLRTETAALQQQLNESINAGPAPKKKRKHRSGRWWGATVCLVLGAMLLPMSVIGRWTSTTLLDTETYVATVSPLTDNDDIQEAIAFRVSEVIVEVIDVEALVRDDLPRGTRFLAGPIEAAAQTLIDKAVQDFVSTDAFARFWADANRLGHEQVVAVFTGDSTDKFDASDGRVVLNIGPLAQGVIGNLDEILGLDLGDSISSERLDGEFVIVDSNDLASLQGTIKLFDQLSVILPILTLALFAASVYLSQRRRIGLRNVGYAIIIPMALCVLLYTWARGQYTSGLPDDIHNPDAAAAVFDITTRFLTRDLWVVLVIGVIILFFTWLLGPTGWAGRGRAWWNAFISSAGDKSTDSEVGEVPLWVAKNERGLLWATFVLGAATLLLWTLPTATVALLISGSVALVMIGIHILGEIGRKADADIQADDDAEAQAAEVEDAHADAAKLEPTDVSP